MSQLFHQVAAPAELWWITGVVTVVFVVIFASWTVWALLPGRAAEFEEAARMPLDDGGDA